MFLFPKLKILTAEVKNRKEKHSDSFKLLKNRLLYLYIKNRWETLIFTLHKGNHSIFATTTNKPNYPHFLQTNDYAANLKLFYLPFLPYRTGGWKRT